MIFLDGENNLSRDRQKRTLIYFLDAKAEYKYLSNVMRIYVHLKYLFPESKRKTISMVLFFF